MKTTKISLIDVFSGSPWEVELIKSLLEKANVQTKVKDEAEMRVAVPSESYTQAMKVLANRM
jgi:ABC-type Zn2+ transport system substrate-binding protein/surface adhesin